MRRLAGPIILVGMAALGASAYQGLIGTTSERQPSEAPEPPAEAEASKWQWNQEGADAYASFEPIAASGTRNGMRMTSSSRVWVGCFDGNRAVAFFLAPGFGGNIDFEISRDRATWERPPTRIHGPYGLAGHIYPGLRDVDAFMRTLDRPLHVRWSMSDDNETYVATWNLSRWHEAVGRASQCGPWPEAPR